MERIVLFDGVCNFCNGSVNFIIRNDPEKRFRFAALQSDAGTRLKTQYSIAGDIDSVVLIENGKAYTHSTAGLRIAKALGGIYSVVYILIVIPASIRDWAYRTFARNRYRLFGRQETCMLPTPDIRDRFLP